MQCCRRKKSYTWQRKDTCRAPAQAVNLPPCRSSQCLAATTFVSIFVSGTDNHFTCLATQRSASFRAQPEPNLHRYRVQGFPYHRQTDSEMFTLQARGQQKHGDLFSNEHMYFFFYVRRHCHIEIRIYVHQCKIFTRVFLKDAIH